MRRPAQYPTRRRKSGMASFPSPTAGWISNRNLAIPNHRDLPPGAEVLDNFFPTATGAVLRRGSAAHAQLGDGTDTVRSLFTYSLGNLQRLFAATDDTIYDVTTPPEADNWELITDEDDFIVTDEDDFIGGLSTDGLEVWEGALGGDWVTAQFATTGGVFLVGVNGESVGFLYDGAAFYPIGLEDSYTLTYEAADGPFEIGDVITGGTSGATATVYGVTDLGGGDGRLIVTDVVGGPFTDGETISNVATVEALIDGPPVLNYGGIDFTGTDLTTADMAYVWVYKNRLFFIEKGTLDVWYLPVDQVTGSATQFPMGGVFGLGGELMFGSSWSLEGGAEGGLSEQCVFVTAAGEVAIYQGTNPGDATAWAKVGTYRIGRPLGHKAHVRAGGDLVIATDIGALALSSAISVAFGALMPAALSARIEVAWAEAVAQRGVGWHCVLWPLGQMVLVAPPTPETADPAVYVANATTGAWAPFTNWHATCFAIFRDRLFFGSTEGFVVEGYVGGTDRGTPYTGVFIPLFSDFGAPSAVKIGRVASITVRSRIEVVETVSSRYDFDTTPPTAPDAAPVPIGNEWDNGVWDQSLWDAGRSGVVTQRRHSLSGSGYRMAPVFQITSGATVPLDAEIVAVDVSYDQGDFLT